MTVAKNIVDTLGTMTFRMLGARNLLDLGDGLSFRIRGSKKANYVKITLNGMDLYDVEFGKVGRAPMFTYTVTSEHSDIYFDMLHDLIESSTGLFTRFNGGSLGTSTS